MFIPKLIPHRVASYVKWWCHVFFSEIFFFSTQASAQLLPSLFSSSFTDVSEKVSALCNWPLQPRGPFCSLPVLVWAKQRVEFGHIPGFVQKPLSVIWPFTHPSTPRHPASAACCADVLSSHPSGCFLERLTSFLWPDQTNNLSGWSFRFQMLGTCLPTHMSAWITSEAISDQRGVAAFVSFRKIECKRLFVSLSQRPARLSESSHFFLLCSLVVH